MSTEMYDLVNETAKLKALTEKYKKDNSDKLLGEMRTLIYRMESIIDWPFKPDSSHNKTAGLTVVLDEGLDEGNWTVLRTEKLKKIGWYDSILPAATEAISEAQKFLPTSKVHTKEELDEADERSKRKAVAAGDLRLLQFLLDKDANRPDTFDWEKLEGIFSYPRKDIKDPKKAQLAHFYRGIMGRIEKVFIQLRDMSRVDFSATHEDERLERQIDECLDKVRENVFKKAGIDEYLIPTNAPKATSESAAAPAAVTLGRSSAISSAGGSGGQAAAADQSASTNSDPKALEDKKNEKEKTPKPKKK